MDIEAKFISATKEFTTYAKHISAPYIRKSFNLESAVANAKITISALGFYRLFINGKEITKGFLAPYISNSDHYVYFDEYDVTPYLQQGENVIGVILGNGMQNAPGGAIWRFQEATFRSAPKFALELKVDDELFLSTDETFKTAPSPIFFDDLRSGCFYDARNEIDGWNSVGFDDSNWNSTFYADIPRGDFKLCTADPITVHDEIKSVKIEKTAIELKTSPFDNDRRNTDGKSEISFETGKIDGYIYDFGINSSCVWKLKIKNTTPGQIISLQPIEMIKNEEYTIENLHYFFPTGYCQKTIYICKGAEEEEFIPSFTYFGCRYCHVSGIRDDQATEGLLTYLEIHSELEVRGGFDCSDETVNKLMDITLRSARSNFVYFPTDCPHREKNGWTGDAAYSCEYVTMNYKTENNFQEWLHNIRKAQKEDGCLPGIVPTGTWGYEWGNGPAWDRIIAYLPYYTYIYRGDKEIIEENAPSIFRYLCYLTTKKNENGLFEFGLGDWCPPDRRADHYQAPLELTDSVMVMSICEKAAYLFGEIGWHLQKKFAQKLYEETRLAIREHLVDFSTMTVAGNSQTSQAIAIFFDVLDNGEKAVAFKRLLEIIHDEGDHISSGYVGNRVIFHVLSMYGESELAYKMITRPDFPSYGYLLEKGATSLWEMFLKEPAGSLNHHFFGDISNWFISKIAGLTVNPHRRNPCEVNVKPNFISALSYAHAYYTTPKGIVDVRWERKDENIIIKIEAPESISGKIILPSGYEISAENDSPNSRSNPDGLREVPLKEGKYLICKI